MNTPNSPGGGRRWRSSVFHRLVVGLSALILAAGGPLLAGCSFGSPFTLGSGATATAVPPSQPAPATPAYTISAPTPTNADPFPERQGEIQQTYSFEYLCAPYTVTLPLYQSSYDYFLSADKKYYYRGNLPDDWVGEFYRNFLDSEDDLDAINGLIDQVSGVINQAGDDLVLALISLVQNLTYDCDKLFSYDYLDGEGYQTNFPYETLFTKRGVCGDTSILLGKILRELGYGAAFLVYQGSNHMALGIECPLEVATYVENGRGYCYLETTGPTRIGVKPDTLGGEAFVEDPLVIPIAEGVSFAFMATLAEEMEEEANAYGELILQLSTCHEVSLYKEILDGQAVIEAHDGHLANLGIIGDRAESDYLEEVELFKSMGCEGTPLPPAQYELCLDQLDIVNEKFAAYEEALNEYNRVVGLRNADLGRVNLAVDTFNNLMDSRDQSCAVVFSERIEVEQESE